MTQDTEILDDVKETLESIDEIKFVGRQFFNPLQAGQNLPAAGIFQGDTPFEMRKGPSAKLTLNVHIYYFVRSTTDVDGALNDVRDLMVGALMADPRRGGHAGHTRIGRDVRGAGVFAPFGLRVALMPPFGGGRLEITCEYHKWYE